jgi:protein-L-isoaspartate(D-aspartate) O-methyltransferase
MEYSIARRLMVERQLIARGIQDRMVIDTMLQVPRHLFVEEALRGQAYSDFPLTHRRKTDHLSTVYGGLHDGSP